MQFTIGQLPTLRRTAHVPVDPLKIELYVMPGAVAQLLLPAPTVA
ncbi:unnamed protein product, partial [marine sediment metagenome]